MGCVQKWIQDMAFGNGAVRQTKRDMAQAQIQSRSGRERIDYPCQHQTNSREVVVGSVINVGVGAGHHICVGRGRGNDLGLG